MIQTEKGDPMSLAKTANGYPILRSSPTPAAKATRAGAFVLCDISSENPDDPFATWWMDEAGHTSTGHYFATRPEANADFETRVAREQRLYGPR
jgi:hypothetical protein